MHTEMRQKLRGRGTSVWLTPESKGTEHTVCSGIDFNAGVIVENEPMEKTCERFIEYIIKVASGEFVNNEKKGYKEIAIFKTGVTL